MYQSLAKTTSSCLPSGLCWVILWFWGFFLPARDSTQLPSGVSGAMPPAQAGPSAGGSCACARAAGEGPVPPHTGDIQGRPRVSACQHTHRHIAHMEKREMTCGHAFTV